MIICGGSCGIYIRITASENLRWHSSIPGQGRFMTQPGICYYLAENGLQRWKTEVEKVWRIQIFPLAIPDWLRYNVDNKIKRRSDNIDRNL